jgi:hypothetical protein
MSELECPNCNTVLIGQKKKENVICKKCLESTGKRFIMVEQKDSQQYDNLGDGFFEKK